jgi:hypothetical protein
MNYMVAAEKRLKILTPWFAADEILNTNRCFKISFLNVFAIFYIEAKA